MADDRFTDQQLKLIHRAVRRYQMEHTVVGSAEYHACDPILDATYDIFVRELSANIKCDI
jgi:hypothetical protein